MFNAFVNCSSLLIIHLTVQADSNKSCEETRWRFRWLCRMNLAYLRSTDSEPHVKLVMCEVALSLQTCWWQKKIKEKCETRHLCARRCQILIESENSLNIFRLSMRAIWSGKLCLVKLLIGHVFVTGWKNFSLTYLLQSRLVTERYEKYPRQCCGFKSRERIGHENELLCEIQSERI